MDVSRLKNLDLSRGLGLASRTEHSVVFASRLFSADRERSEPRRSRGGGDRTVRDASRVKQLTPWLSSFTPQGIGKAWDGIDRKDRDLVIKGVLI